MKIAIARQTYMAYGGAERFVERAASALRGRGIDLTIIARSWEGEQSSGFVRCNPFFIGRTWRDASFSRCVRKIIESGRFDLVQSHERIPGCQIYRAGDGVHATWLELRGRARGRASRIASTLSLWHRYTLAAEAALFRHPNLKAVICNSRMVRDDVARRFGLATDRLHVIRNGIDIARFHPNLKEEFRRPVRSRLGIDDETPVILFVGSGFERKGVPLLLQAMSRLHRRDIVLLVVGKDRHSVRMTAMAHSLGLSERVHFLGGHSDVRPFYGCADMFCLPTLYDPMPNAALEALACGLPVITTTTSGAAELIRSGENGYVCDAFDVSELADRLNSLLEPGVASRMSDRARASAEPLAIDNMAQQLVALYEQLVGTGKAPVSARL